MYDLGLLKNGEKIVIVNKSIDLLSNEIYTPYTIYKSEGTLYIKFSKIKDFKNKFEFSKQIKEIYTIKSTSSETIHMKNVVDLGRVRGFLVDDIKFEYNNIISISKE